MDRRFTILARWLGWTVVYTGVFSVWSASLFPQSSLRLPGSEIVFWGSVLGLAALVFAIGVRFANWSWMMGVFVASVLQMFIVASVLPWPAESGQAGLLLIFVAFLGFLLMLPAGAGVWWSKRRHAADAGLRRGDPGGSAPTPDPPG